MLAVDLFAGAAPSQAPTACDGEGVATSPCALCSKEFKQRVRHHRFCSESCRSKFRRRGMGIQRACRVCEAPFVIRDDHASNRQHCSPACSRESARRSRIKFAKEKPERTRAHREKAKKTEAGTVLERLCRKYPWLPRACESCGERRVLDIAHRPEFKRNGAWRVYGNTRPHHIWILCPTCHALLDRLGMEPEALGLSCEPRDPREVETNVGR